MTAYEYEVKSRLLRFEKTQEWLAEQVKSKNGGFMDKSQISRVIRGKANSPRTIKAINEILGIKEGEYDG